MLENTSSQLIAGPAGELEIAISLPKTTVNNTLGIICHPHPQMGGTMHNKVVTTIAGAFNELGITSIRFNYRGIGLSAGMYGFGKGEVADLLAVYDWAAQYSNQAIYLAGFSFGSYISLAGATQRSTKQLITIAPAVHLFDFIQLSEPNCPWLIVQGENDEIVDSQQVYDYATHRDQPPKLIRMANTSHFFHGQLVNLKKLLIENINL